MSFLKSKAAFKAASKVLVGGVNSPVRSFSGVGGSPVFFKSGRGSTLEDIDNNSYLDYVASWGAIILGHSDDRVIQAAKDQLNRGTSFGAPTLLETEMASLIKRCLPFAEKIRMVSSGTEATFSAIRLARGYTRKDKIIKFKGCYHGHGDSFLIEAGSGALTLGKPNSPGVTKTVAKDTLIIEYNDTEQLRKVFQKYKDIAAVIIEPIAGNMGLIPAKKEFLSELRDITKRNQSLLIFDEVMSGFRVSRGGASELYGVTPDLICLGKVMGGGMPAAAFAGKKEIMKHLAPEGDVYQAGTLSGNPLAMTCGITVLKEILRDKQFYAKLNEKTSYLTEQIRILAEQYKIELLVKQTGGMFSVFFNPLQEINNFLDVKQSDLKAYSFFFHSLLKLGSYFPPSQFESAFMTQAHTKKNLDETLNQVESTFKKLNKKNERK